MSKLKSKKYKQKIANKVNGLIKEVNKKIVCFDFQDVLTSDEKFAVLKFDKELRKIYSELVENLKNDE